MNNNSSSSSSLAELIGGASNIMGKQGFAKILGDKFGNFLGSKQKLAADALGALPANSQPSPSLSSSPPPQPQPQPPPENNEGGGFAESLESAGMPCKFELTMEFICYFLFTFIIYFCVFYFIPYDKLINKVFKFIENTFKKFLKFINKLIPDSFKKKVSKLFPRFIVKFFTKTLPNLLKAKVNEAKKPLEEKLEKIKSEAEKKLKKFNKPKIQSKFDKSELFKISCKSSQTK